MIFMKGLSYLKIERNQMIDLRYRTFNQRRKGCGNQFGSTAPADAQSSMAQKVAPPTENDEEDVAQ